MADPLSILSLVGTGISAFGSLQEGKQIQQADEYNAQLALEQGEMDVFQIEKEEAGLTSTQKAAYAKAGVTLSGSPLEVMLQSATNFEMDKATAKYNAESKANMLRYEGKVAKASGKFNAAKILMGSAVNTAGSIPTHSAGDSSSGEDELSSLEF